MLYVSVSKYMSSHLPIQSNHSNSLVQKSRHIFFFSNLFFSFNKLRSPDDNIGPTLTMGGKIKFNSKIRNHFVGGLIILICQGLLNLPVANHFNSPSHYHTFLSWAASINRVRSGAGASCFVWLQPIGKSFPLLHLKSVKPVGSSQRRVRLEITQFKETPWLS